MAFLSADSFQSSLNKLNGEEQKAAKLAAFELQIDSANPALQCHSDRAGPTHDRSPTAQSRVGWGISVNPHRDR